MSGLIYVPCHCKNFRLFLGRAFEQLLQKSLFLVHAVVAQSYFWSRKCLNTWKEEMLQNDVALPTRSVVTEAG